MATSPVIPALIPLPSSSDIGGSGWKGGLGVGIAGPTGLPLGPRSLSGTSCLMDASGSGSRTGMGSNKRMHI
jgi:hypothetical protein